MVKKPSELINGPASPATVPTTASGRTSGGGSSGLLTLVVALLAAWLIYSVISRSDWGDDRKQDDHHEQKDDDKKQDDKKQDDKQEAATVKPGILYMVHDFKSSPIDHTLLVEDVKAMRDQVKGFEFRRIDDNSDNTPEAQGIIKHAESKGVKPPFVAFKPAGKSIENVIAWPKDKTELMKVFK